MTTVRTASADDVAAVVTLHLESFRGFFLTLLGPRFLKRFYAAVLREPACVCLVAHDDAGLAGFAVGPLEPNGFFRSLLFRQGAGFVVDALPALLANPGLVAQRLARGALYRGEPPPEVPGAALLSSIAVRPSVSGSGLAGALVEAFCREAAARGASLVYLTTDRDDNVAANRFYLKHGFRAESVTVRHDGRPMIRYVRHLDEAADPRETAERAS